MLIIDKDINIHLQQNYINAQKSIKIIAYSMTRANPRSHKLFIDTWQTLEKAIKRGIKTQVILEQWNDLNPQASESAQVRKLLESYGAQVRMAKKGTCMHSKTWLFDEKTLIIGSHNSTHAGLTITKNLSITTTKPSIIKDYNDYFNKEWGNLEPHVYM